MTRCRAAAAMRHAAQRELCQHLFYYHAGTDHLLVVDEADAKRILQFRQRVERHVLPALQYLRHILLGAVHTLCEGLM